MADVEENQAHEQQWKARLLNESQRRSLATVARRVELAAWHLEEWFSGKRLPSLHSPVSPIHLMLPSALHCCVSCERPPGGSGPCGRLPAGGRRGELCAQHDGRVYLVMVRL